MKMNPRIGGMLVIGIPVAIVAFASLYPKPPLPGPKPVTITANDLASLACEKRNEVRTAMVEAHDLESGNLIVLRTPEEMAQAAGLEDCDAYLRRM